MQIQKAIPLSQKAIDRLKLMQTLLIEVEAGTWAPSEGVRHVPGGDGETKTVDELHPPGFDLDEWLTPHLATRRDLKEQGCGTAACAVGHAMLDARFNELGLSMSASLGPWYSILGEPWGDGWEAVVLCFDIPVRLANHFFARWRYVTQAHMEDINIRLPVITPMDVWRRINDQLIDGTETPVGGEL